MSGNKVVILHQAAPDKPAYGDVCNGCGVCCASETCPVGLVRFVRRRGPCPALLWDEAAGRYWCGMVAWPGRFLPWLPAGLARRLTPLFARWIAAGRFCDSSVVVEGRVTPP
jgi:hypothetical protein